MLDFGMWVCYVSTWDDLGRHVRESKIRHVVHVGLLSKQPGQ